MFYNRFFPIEIFVTLWTTSTPLFGVSPKSSRDVLGLRFSVASITAQASCGASVADSTAARHCQPWATGICLLSIVKQG